MTQYIDKLQNQALPNVQQGNLGNKALITAFNQVTRVDPFGFRTAREIRIRSFGVFEVYFDQELVPNSAWRSPKNRHFMAYLAAHMGQPLSEKRILEEFWEGKTKSNLYSACSRVRSCLKEANPAADLVVRDSGTIYLNQEANIWHDLDELRRLEAASKSSKPAQIDTRAVFQSLSKLCRGPYLEDCNMDWVEPLRLRVNRITVDTLNRLLQVARTNQDSTLVEEIAQKMLQVDSCNLEATLTLMKYFARRGRPEQAARQFKLYANLLKREFSMEPTVEALRAYHEIIQGSQPATLIG